MSRSIKLVRTVQLPILRQLQLEEALLRADRGNWCILNDGAAHPAVVVGISGYVVCMCASTQLPGESCRSVVFLLAGTYLCRRFVDCCLLKLVSAFRRKPDQLVNLRQAKEANIQLIKRFSGGGTVVVDTDTQFVTLVVEGRDLPEVECYPRPVMRWTETFYSPLFALHGDFQLREHGIVSRHICLSYSVQMLGP